MKLKKQIIRFIAVLLAVSAFIFAPFLLSSFTKSGEAISFTTVNSGFSDEISAWPSYTSEAELIGEMVKIAENSRYRLHIHERLAAVALYDKTQNCYMLSNPYDIETDGSETDENRNRQRSQLLLTYFTDDFSKQEMNSFSDCVARHQFVIESINNGAEVRMTLGKLGETLLIPEMISGKLMASLMEKLEEYDRYTLEAAYRHYTLDAATPELRETLMEKYPYLSQDDLYESLQISNREKKNLSAILESAGLTREMIQDDYELTGYMADDRLPAFTLSIRYTLEDDGLKTSVNLDEVSYRTKYYQVDTITLLPYFGCGRVEDTTGELLVPDGCGAVITYNSGFTKRLSSLTMKVYGQDSAEVSNKSDFATTKQARLPVFGNTSDRGAYLAVIEEGESVCSITAFAGDITDAYPTAYATAQYRYNETFYYDDKDFGRDVVAFADVHNAGNFTVKYLPLAKGGNYADMAFAYKDYLMRLGAISPADIQPGLILQLLGYGSDSEGQFALTTFKDAATVLNELGGLGVERLSLRYLGWAGGGLDNRYTKKVSPPDILGGRGGWENLTGAAQSQNVELYMDMELAYVRQQGFLDGFSPNRDGNRNIRNKLSGIYPYNYGDSDINPARLFYGVSAAKLNRDIGKIYDSFSSGLKGARISAGSLGTALDSTFKNGSAMTRPQAQLKQSDSLAKLAAGGRLMLEDANAYALTYCGVVVNLPVTSSGYASTDYDVPFYQLAVNGCVEYAISPFNESENPEGLFLKAIETGSSISYIAAYRNQNKLKSSSQSGYYSIDYNALKQDIADTYAKYAQVMDAVGSSVITGHKRLAKDVYQTTYQNGAVVTVNYGGTDYVSDRLTVKTKGYACETGGEGK